MSFFKKILGKKSPTPASDPSAAAQTPAADAPKPNPVAAAFAAESAVPPPPAEPEAEANLMPMLDEQGREVKVTRAEWRERVLLPHLAKIQDQPEVLATTILQSLPNGFLTDMVEPAEQLARIDPNPERGAVILSIVYRELGRTESAETVLRQYVERHGESAVVVVNLGLVQAARGETEAAEQNFWHALELDVNHPEAFGALLASRHKQGGDEAVESTLAQVEALPGNWRARMLRARAALDQKNVEAALALYREVIELAGKPVPTDLLMQMTGDLGHTGHADILLKEAAPLYEVEKHGLQGAHNLYHACLQTGELLAARGLLDLLFAQQHFEWRQALGHWENELAQARMAQAAQKAQPGSGKLTLLVDDGPIWLPPQSPAAELFTASVGQVPIVAFLGSSAESPVAEGNQGPLQLSDAPGRFSRALPLFLAEQVHFGLQARVRPLAPWVMGETPAFIVGRQPWTAAEAAQHARGVKPGCDFIVVVHVQAQTEPWHAEVRLVRAADAAVLGTVAAELTLRDPEAALRALVADVLGLLQREAQIEAGAAPAEYVVPTGRDFGLYLLCLEQLHSVRCHALPGVPPGTLMGERDLLDGALHLCITQPQNVGVRLILAELLRLLRPGRPTVVAEYRKRVELLQKDKPLPGSAQAVLLRIFDSLYAEPRKA